MSGAVYHGGKELQQIQNQAFSLFSLSNPLHPDTFPFVRKMEAEVIAMTLDYFDANTINNAGIMTSGGTESIMMAIRCYKQWARQEKGITNPELVAPQSAHAAFEKGCELMEIKYIKVPCDEQTIAIDPNAMRRHITKNTIAIVGSTPSYGTGTCDPIAELSKLALEFNIGLHVDCCLGSFIMPTLKRIGRPVDPFTFELPGVTTISCDTHKFGFALKGTSVLMFRDSSLRTYGYFLFPDSSIGMYATPTFAGSRSGGVIAATWSVLMSIGSLGYEKATREIMIETDKIRAAIESIDELFVVGQPAMCIVAFASKQFDVYCVSESMKNKGWVLNNCQYPTCVHICVTYKMREFADQLIVDLKESVRDVIKNPQNYKQGSAAAYGTLVSLPDNTFKGGILCQYMDVCYEA